jgi:predicted SnoaL-like aldol condensation-catalyzing enzyme
MNTIENGTDGNRRVIEDFARVFYAERDVSAAFRAHIAENYVQHNPAIADGRQTAVDALADKFATSGARFDAQRILVDGEVALIHIKASFPGRPLAAVADIYRLEAGKVGEHWDVFQPMPDGTAQNPHPMF